MEDCYVVLTFDSVVKILWCDQSNLSWVVQVYFLMHNYLFLFFVNCEFNKLFFVNP